MPRRSEENMVPMKVRAIDWWQYMDGHEWVFTEGEDYDPGAHNKVQQSAHNWCQRNNDAVRMAIAVDPHKGDPAVFQSHREGIIKVRTKVMDRGAAVHIRAYFPYRPVDQQVEAR